MSAASRKVNDLLNLECPAGITVPSFPSDLVGVSRLLLQVQWVPGRHSLVRDHGPLSFEMIFSMSFPAVPPTVKCLTRDFIPPARAAGLSFDAAGRPTLPLFSTSSDGVGWSRLCSVTDLLFALAYALEKDEEPLMRILALPSIQVQGGSSAPTGGGAAGSAERQGRRPTMEDVVLTSTAVGTLAHAHGGFPASPRGGSGGSSSRGGPSASGPAPQATVSAVFDGHGGNLASEFCAGHVSSVLSRTDPGAVNLTRKLFELLQETDAALASHAAAQAPGMGRAFAGAGGFHMAGLPSSPAVSATPPRPTGYVSRTTKAAAKAAAKLDTSGATACVVLHIPKGVQGGSRMPADGAHAMRTVVRMTSQGRVSAETGADAAHPHGETEHGTTILTSDVDSVPALESVDGSVAGEAGALVVAHVGDSRAVLSVLASPPSTGTAYSLIAVELTNDHKATTRSDERARILCAGGIVLQGRVQGRLAVTRALGDFSMKHSDTGDFLVTPEPEICLVPLHSGCEFVIVACDGLWDVMTSAEAVKLARDTLVKHMTGNSSNSAVDAANAAAVQLAESALGRGSSDNVSVVVKLLSGVHLRAEVQAGEAVGISASMVLQAIQPSPAAANAGSVSGLVRNTPSGSNPFAAKSKSRRSRAGSSDIPRSAMQQPAPSAAAPRAMEAPQSSTSSQWTGSSAATSWSSAATSSASASWSATSGSDSLALASSTAAANTAGSARSAVQSLFSQQQPETSAAGTTAVSASDFGSAVSDSLSELMGQGARGSTRSSENSAPGRSSHVRSEGGSLSSISAIAAEGVASLLPSQGAGDVSAAPIPSVRHSRAVGSHRSRRHRATNSNVGGGGHGSGEGGLFAPPLLSHGGALGVAASGVLSAPDNTTSFSSTSGPSVWASAPAEPGSGRSGGSSSGRPHIPTPLPTSGRGGKQGGKAPLWASPAAGNMFGSIPEGGSATEGGGVDALSQLMAAGSGGSATLGSGRNSGRRGGRRPHSPIQPLGGGEGGGFGLGGSASESVLPSMSSQGGVGGFNLSPAAARQSSAGPQTGGLISRSSGGPGLFASPPQRHGHHQRSASHGRRAAGMPPVSPIQPGATAGIVATSSSVVASSVTRTSSYGRRGNAASNAARRMLG